MKSDSKQEDNTTGFSYEEWRQKYDEWYRSCIGRENNLRRSKERYEFKNPKVRLKKAKPVGLEALQRKSSKLAVEYRKTAYRAEIHKVVDLQDTEEPPFDFLLFSSKKRKRNSTKRKGLNPSILFIAAFIYSSKDRESSLGDLEERFKKDCKVFNRRKAHLIVARDLLVSIYPTTKAALVKLFKWATFYAILKRIIS
jgi:hypothetical protein